MKKSRRGEARIDSKRILGKKEKNGGSTTSGTKGEEEAD